MSNHRSSLEGALKSFKFSWTIGLKEQTKIVDAYSMLKKQGIVKTDPKFDERLMLPTPQPRLVIIYMSHII